MKKMLSPRTILMVVVALLSVSACVSTSTPGAAEATASIAQQKDIARQWAEKLKHTPNVDAAALQTGEQKYREAASQNKGYLVAVGNAIINNENLESNPSYKALAEKAQKSTDDFVSFAKTATGVPGAQRSVSAAVLAGVLVESGIAVWKAHRAEALAARQAAASNLITQNSWADWDKI